MFIDNFHFLHLGHHFSNFSDDTTQKIRFSKIWPRSTQFKQWIWVAVWFAYSLHFLIVVFLLLCSNRQGGSNKWAWWADIFCLLCEQKCSFFWPSTSSCPGTYSQEINHKCKLFMNTSVSNRGIMASRNYSQILFHTTGHKE